MSSLVTVVGGAVIDRSLEEVEDIRWELLDGLLIIVITKRSSVGCGVVALRFGTGIFKNEDRFDFELSDDVDDDGDADEEIDLTITESVESNWDVDCALYRGLKCPFELSSDILMS